MIGTLRTGSARLGLAGVIAGLGLASALGIGHTRRAIAEPAPHDPGGTLAFFSAPANGSAPFLTLVDTKTQAVALYRIDPQNPKGAIKLEATRQCRYDLKLAEYNNQAPDVASIQSMVEAARR